MALSRRSFLRNCLLGSTLFISPALSYALQQDEGVIVLSANELENGFWAYQNISGNFTSFRKKDPVRVHFKNNLTKQKTSIHWHGLRLPNEMDGVPYLTQDPINPQEEYEYQFIAHDSGTYFFHPHFNTPEQVERGLKGAFIVQEDHPPIVDKEHILVMDDIILDEKGDIVSEFDNQHDQFHDGRLGDFYRLNGQANIDIKTQLNQRLRLRLICATNARFFNLGFGEMSAWLIAKDGQSVGEPINLKDKNILFGSGQRLDIILDIDKEDIDYTIYSLGHQNTRIPLAHFVVDGHSDSKQITQPLKALETNDLPFDVSAQSATLVDATLRGGMMGEITKKMRKKNNYWSIGNVSMKEGQSKIKKGRAWVFNKGEDYILRMENLTRYDHPMHMHGHFFKVLNGTDEGLWMDTVIVPAEQTIDILFRAEAVGKWMFHCHILEHAASGMMVWFEVKA